MPKDTLTLRALNRATLARQLLLEQERLTPLDAIERLAGLQAQLARPPFVGLWTRVPGFEREHLRAVATERKVVRATMMRGTLHLVTASDYGRLRPLLQPMLTAGMRAILGERAAALDLDKVVHAARALLEEQPRAFEELRPLLVKQGLSADERAMGYAVRMLIPLVQVPSTDAEWGWDAKAPFALADTWLGATGPGAKRKAAPAPEASLATLVRRYLAAFGPATPADATAWSGLKGLREVFTALRPELRVLRDEAGRELFDLPDAPRPGEDVDAPVRFLPEFDNLVLSHDDRTRVLADAHRTRVVSKNLQVAATFLVDGTVAGTWTEKRARGTAVLTLRPFGKLTKRDRSELEEEGQRLLHFLEADAKAHEVKFEASA